MIDLNKRSALRLAALQPPADRKSDGVLALMVGENQVGLQITSGGGVTALRALDGVIENEPSQRVLHAKLVAREARITLGQLPEELRAAVKSIRIFGARDLAQQLADEMMLTFEPMGLEVELVTAYAPTEFGVQLPPEATMSARSVWPPGPWWGNHRRWSICRPNPPPGSSSRVATPRASGAQSGSRPRRSCCSF